MREIRWNWWIGIGMFLLAGTLLLKNNGFIGEVPTLLLLGLSIGLEMGALYKWRKEKK